MKKSLVVIPVLALLALGCAYFPDSGRVSKTGEAEEWAEEGITKNYIFARGTGAADQTLKTKTQKMATSRNAAIAGAQSNLIALITGATLEGGASVKKAMEDDSSLEAKINAAAGSARVVRSEYTRDDRCVVVLKLSKKTLREAGIKIR